MLTHWEQMLPVAGREHIRSRLDRTRQNRVVHRIARDRLDELRRRRLLDRYLCEQGASCVNLLRLESELVREHPLELCEYELGHEKLEPAVDRLLEQAARWSVCDQRRDENVGVTDDAKRQSCPPRISSTSASASSGPMPRSSARVRP